MPILTNQASAEYQVAGHHYSTLSNQSLFSLYTASLTAIKSQNPTSGTHGDLVTFTIILSNSDIQLPVTNIELTDDLASEGYTFVANSTKIDGVHSPDSPQTGIHIGNVTPLGTKTITFDATVN